MKYALVAALASMDMMGVAVLLREEILLWVL